MSSSLSIWWLVWLCWCTAVNSQLPIPFEGAIRKSPNIISKLEYPSNIEKLIADEGEITKSYSSEQLDKFVANGLAYLKSKSKKRKWEAWSVWSPPFLQKKVIGIDDLVPRPINEAVRPWRYLPLLEQFKIDGKHVYHLQKWKNGEITRTPDLLRMDYFGRTESSWFIPTAIVRPRVGERGKLSRFELVQHYPTSFVLWLQDPGMNKERRFWETVMSASSKWVADMAPEEQRRILGRLQQLTNVRDLKAYIDDEALHRKERAAATQSQGPLASYRSKKRLAEASSSSRAQWPPILESSFLQERLNPALHRFGHTSAFHPFVPNQPAAESENDSLDLELRLGH